MSASFGSIRNFFSLESFFVLRRLFDGLVLLFFLHHHLPPNVLLLLDVFFPPRDLDGEDATLAIRALCRFERDILDADARQFALQHVLGTQFPFLVCNSFDIHEDCSLRLRKDSDSAVPVFVVFVWYVSKRFLRFSPFLDVFLVVVVAKNTTRSKLLLFYPLTIFVLSPQLHRALLTRVVQIIPPLLSLLLRSSSSFRVVVVPKVLLSVVRRPVFQVSLLGKILVRHVVPPSSSSSSSSRVPQSGKVVVAPRKRSSSR